MNLRKFLSTFDRRQAVEKELKLPLPHIGTYSLDEKIASTRHCENMIGVTQVPLGIAGPLVLTSSDDGLSHEYYLPLATTEGALIASVNRGCKAITESGGVYVSVERVGVTRGPVFKVDSLVQGQALQGLLQLHFNEVKKVAEATSNHLKLLDYALVATGKYRYVRFNFDTQDAMGLNMVTIATQAITQYIKDKTGITCIALSGNFCVDKKPSWQNFVQGRGFRVHAEATFPERILQSVLKTTAHEIYDVWLAKCMIGSAISGSLGYNAQFANVVAALFLATGQDIAHVTEGSMGIVTAEVVQGTDLYMAVDMPDVLVGTVGGGTGLATQQEALSLLGVAGGKEGNNSSQLAAIVGGAVLAGEVSLLSSLEQGTLAQAHQRLGRGQI